jgi:hypothetical protein
MKNIRKKSIKSQIKCKILKKEIELDFFESPSFLNKYNFKKNLFNCIFVKNHEYFNINCLQHSLHVFLINYFPIMNEFFLNIKKNQTSEVKNLSKDFCTYSKFDKNFIKLEFLKEVIFFKEFLDNFECRALFSSIFMRSSDFFEKEIKKKTEDNKDFKMINSMQIQQAKLIESKLSEIFDLDKLKKTVLLPRH